VPGISAALGAAAATHLPLTHRECSASVTFATAHAASADGDPHLADTVPRVGTVVLYMGLGRLAQTAEALIAAGRAASTPVAVIANATRKDQRIVVATLATIDAEVRAAGIDPPAIVVVGEVVSRIVESPASIASITAGATARACGE
jgi:siroheme synthase